jgi:hypothetical protein
VDARPPGVSLESIIIQDGPFWADVRPNRDHNEAGEGIYELIEPLCSTKSCWTSSNDQNVYISRGIGISVSKVERLLAEVAAAGG